MLDNPPAHKTQAVEQFLVDHPKGRLHFTPAYSSWLNKVEIWFAKIERDVIARGVFTSVSDLRRKLMKYIRTHAERAVPVISIDTGRAVPGPYIVAAVGAGHASP